MTLSQTAILAAAIAKNFPEATVKQVAVAVQAMQKAAKANVTVGTNRCNYPFTEEQVAKQDKRLAKLEHEAKVSFFDMGVAVEVWDLTFGGDPRGTCGTLTIGDREYAIY